MQLMRGHCPSSGPQVNLSDALNRVPGVVALNRNNYAQDVQISIRGFGARAAFGLRGIRLITDGIPATTSDGQGQASTVSLTSTERIEVLTGPLAQLYGNASGGVIQTFTREAGTGPELHNQLFLGSFGMKRTDWQMSDRLGQVGIVADYSTFGINGYRANSDARRQQLNSVITLDAQLGTRLKLIVNVFDMPYAKDALGLTAAQFRTPDIAGTWVGLIRHFDGLGVQLNGKGRVLGDTHIDWVVGLDKDHSGEHRLGHRGGAGLDGALTAVGRRQQHRQRRRLRRVQRPRASALRRRCGAGGSLCGHQQPEQPQHRGLGHRQPSQQPVFRTRAAAVMGAGCAKSPPALTLSWQLPIQTSHESPLRLGLGGTSI